MSTLYSTSVTVISLRRVFVPEKRGRGRVGMCASVDTGVGTTINIYDNFLLYMIIFDNLSVL